MGIFKPKVGVAAGAGLVLYFAGAISAHVVAGDFEGLKSPIVPLVVSGAALALRVVSMRRAGPRSAAHAS